MQSFRDIIDELGPGFMSQEEVSAVADKALRIVSKSLERIIENNKAAENDDKEDEDDEWDEEDFAIIKEKNSNEFDLQFVAAELMGVLFKTHKEFSGDLVMKLQNEVLPQAFASGDQKRRKFALFILDDMVEHLGPSYFNPEQFAFIVNTICSFSSSTSATLRQASAYGIGIIAQNSGASFQSCAELCLTSLRAAIDFAMTPNVADKQVKKTQFHHARDNAIASIGKIIKYQTEYVRGNPTLGGQLVSYWLGLLPITHDIEEAQCNLEFISDFLQADPEFILGADPVGSAAQLAKIFGESYQEKYFSENSEQKKKMALSIKYLVAGAPQPILDSFKATCENVISEEARNRLTAGFTFANSQ